MCLVVALLVCTREAGAQQKPTWEITPASEKALHQGLEWLSLNQGAEGNWNCKNLGLVSLGALAFLADGHSPGHGKYGPAVQKAINYVVVNARPSGLFNQNGGGPDMYNHGLSTFVLGQAYGMTDDKRVGPALDKALKVIIQCQGPGGSWGYSATPQDGDLSLLVMQAKALRSAVDSGFDIPPTVIQKAIVSARGRYVPEGCNRTDPDEEQRKHPGRFTYNGSPGSVAMAAAGCVCMQEFAQYDDWRIDKSLDFVENAVRETTSRPGNAVPFDSYTLYYVAQALYQAGGERWKRCYPLLRDRLVAAQTRKPNDIKTNGSWGSDFWATSVCCFVLAIPNRYLPILQEGKIDSLRKQFGTK